MPSPILHFFLQTTFICPEGLKHFSYTLSNSGLSQPIDISKTNSDFAELASFVLSSSPTGLHVLPPDALALIPAFVIVGIFVAGEFLASLEDAST